jgi:hypothetical protein
MEPSTMSMAQLPNLLGQFEHHSPTTDGSISICIEGIFISLVCVMFVVRYTFVPSNVCTLKALLESIPVEHHPALDTTNAGQSIKTIVKGEFVKSIGTTFIPVIIKDWRGYPSRSIRHCRP